MDLPYELKHKISDNMFLQSRELLNPRENVIYEKTLIENVEKGKIYEWIEIDQNFKNINYLMAKKLTFHTTSEFADELNNFVNVNEFEIVLDITTDYVFETLGEKFIKNINSLKIIFTKEQESEDYRDSFDTIIQDINTLYKNLVKLEILISNIEEYEITDLIINPKLKYLKITNEDNNYFYMIIDFSNAISLKKIVIKDIDVVIQNLNSLNLDRVDIEARTLNSVNSNFTNVDTLKIIGYDGEVHYEDKTFIDCKFENIKNLHLESLNLKSQTSIPFKNCENIYLDDINVVYNNFRN